MFNKDPQVELFASLFILFLVGLYCVYCAVKSYIIITHYLG